MKELSIEEKAKRYDEAIEKAKDYHKQLLDEDNPEWASEIERIFPELKESEDERIRKALMQNLKERFGTKGNMGEGLDMPDVLAWLEKQGEKKSIWHNEDEEPQKDSLILLIMQSGTPIVAKIIEPNHTFNHGERWAYIDDLLEKQGEQKPAESINDAYPETLDKAIDLYYYSYGNGNGYFENLSFEKFKDIVKTFVSDYSKQKPAWSEEDEDRLNSCVDAINAVYKWDGMIAWLKAIKDRVLLQPKQEWSEEDRETIDNLIDYLESELDSSYTKEDKEEFTKQIELLKSLRPQSTWKPSKEQLNGLKEAIEFLGCTKTRREQLQSLYEQLKKLREEKL